MESEKNEVEGNGIYKKVLVSDFNTSIVNQGEKRKKMIHEPDASQVLVSTSQLEELMVEQLGVQDVYT